MSTQRIRILGTQSSGKTVLLGALTHRLASAVSYPRITGENIATLRYTAGIMDALESGNWPASTAVGLRQDLRWLWRDSDHDAHELLTFDCAGQDFRAIFETEADDDEGLSAQQLALREAFFSSDLVLLLFNFQDALDIYQKHGKNQARIEVEVAPAIAIRRLRAAGITVYIILTQADRYRERIAQEWHGDYSGALRAVVPQLFHALQETGTPYLVVSAVETEERDGKVLPKKIKHTGEGVSDVIKNVENFFAVAKRREREKKQAEEYAAKKAAEREENERRQREEAENRIKQEEDDRLRMEKEKKEKNDRKAAWGCLIVTVSMFIVALIMGKINGSNEEAKAQAAEAEEKRKAEEKIKMAEINKKLNEGFQFKELHVVPSLNLVMRGIPAGVFIMGSPTTEPKRGDDEIEHYVTISKPFYLGMTEVTQGQWEKLMGDNPSSFRAHDRYNDSAPVETVSWEDAMAFCLKLTEHERASGALPKGYIYTLPTEAQWEYACRAGTTTPFNTGNNLTTEQANYDGNHPYVGKAKRWERGKYREETVYVKSFVPNAWGLYDMHGNVWEWCLDWYGAYPTAAVVDPKGPSSGNNRVLRGGGWFSGGARYCRSANRFGRFAPSTRFNAVGFRLALVPVTQ
jgi:formylglycine-generating enzyme required for sulfatase activity